MKQGAAVLVPVILLVGLRVAVPWFGLTAQAADGVRLGLLVAIVQSLLTVAAQRWAWNKSCFYWVWGSGLLLRAIVLVVTAVVVYQREYPDLMLTLLSLVVATTLFLVVESLMGSRKI